MTGERHDLYPLVEVVWADALGPFDVEDLETQRFAVTRSRTVGWLIHSDAELVAIATTYDWEPEHDGWRDVTTIPYGMVLEVNYLRSSHDG